MTEVHMTSLSFEEPNMQLFENFIKNNEFNNRRRLIVNYFNSITYREFLTIYGCEEDIALISIVYNNNIRVGAASQIYKLYSVYGKNENWYHNSYFLIANNNGQLLGSQTEAIVDILHKAWAFEENMHLMQKRSK